MAIIEKLEQNFICHLTWLHAATDGMEVRESQSCVVSECDVPTDTFNTIYCKRCDTPSFEADLRTAVERFRSLQFPFAVWIGNHSNPDDELLRRIGLRPVEFEPILFADLNGWQPPDTDSPVRIERVRSNEGIDDLIRCLATLSDPPDPTMEAFYRRASAATFAPDCPMHFFVGYYGDEPVATCEVCFTETTAGIYMVVTHPKYQRRGIGSAMMVAGMRAAVAGGCDFVVLSASEAGLPVYKRLGFQECGSYTAYRLEEIPA